MFTFTHRNPEMLLDKEQTALVLADIQNERIQGGLKRDVDTRCRRQVWKGK
jgi:hypothetical protein